MAFAASIWDLGSLVRLLR